MGNRKQSKIASFRRGERQAAPKNSTLPRVLPQAIEIAINLVAPLVERYLWAGAYCTGQTDDVVVVRDQINSMALIYEKAMCTLIVTSGNYSKWKLWHLLNDDSGLSYCTSMVRCVY